jgi:predicted phage terminase large subunit-like protein
MPIDGLRGAADAVESDSLVGFVRQAWHVLEPGATYIHNWHVDEICRHLEAVTDGKIQRLLINVPPGFSKSMLVSVFWPAWEWGPRGMRSLRFLTTSYNDQPVKRDTRKCRDLILSDWYQARWPEVRLTRTAEMSFANSDTGTREGVAFGSLTSQRGDRMIIDDPHSTRTIEGASQREETTRLFRERAIFSVNDPKKSAVVVVMQRLHEKDISGVILERKLGFEHLRLPMRFEADNPCVTILGRADRRTFDGELLDYHRFPEHIVEALEKDMTAYAVGGQLQQRPAPREGGLFQRHWLPIVGAAPADSRRVRCWDLAASTSKSADWTVGALLARASGSFYVEDIVRLRGSPHEVETAILNTAARDRARYGNVRIGLPQDPGAAGLAQSQYLVSKLAGYTVKTVRETGSKEIRAMPLASQAEAGNVRIVAGPWNTAFLDEIETFPAGAHDDQVDAVAGAFALLSEHSSFDTWISLVRSGFFDPPGTCRVEPVLAPGEKLLRFLVGPTATSVTLRNGREAMAINGVVEVTAAEAEGLPLKRAPELQEAVTMQAG